MDNNQISCLEREVMRNIVVCIFVIQSWCVWADNNVLNKDLSNSKNYSFTTNHISNNTDINGVFSQTYNLNNITLNHFSGDNSTLSEQVQNFSKLLFTHNQSLFKPEVFQAQEQNQISLHYLHFGQNIALTPAQNTWLYSGAGLTYFDSQNSQYNDNTALSFSVGAHSKLFVNNQKGEVRQCHFFLLPL